MWRPSLSVPPHVTRVGGSKTFVKISLLWRCKTIIYLMMLHDHLTMIHNNNKNSIYMKSFSCFFSQTQSLVLVELYLWLQQDVGTESTWKLLHRHSAMILYVQIMSKESASVQVAYITMLSLKREASLYPMLRKQLHGARITNTVHYFHGIILFLDKRLCLYVFYILEPNVTILLYT